jgi:predicted ribonuclease toxin of YeeF-YezG toxin-antitoxin module
MKNFVFALAFMVAICGTVLAQTEQDMYPRPSYSTEFRQQVWDNAREVETGQVRDPLTGEFMSKDKPWDVGHKPGYEFSKAKDSAINRALTTEEFQVEQKNPNIVRPELPSSNRSHKLEAPPDVNHYPKPTYWQTFKRYVKPVVKTMSKIL